MSKKFFSILDSDDSDVDTEETKYDWYCVYYNNHLNVMDWLKRLKVRNLVFNKPDWIPSEDDKLYLDIFDKRLHYSLNTELFTFEVPRDFNPETDLNRNAHHVTQKLYNYYLAVHHLIVVFNKHIHGVKTGTSLEMETLRRFDRLMGNEIIAKFIPISALTREQIVDMAVLKDPSTYTWNSFPAYEFNLMGNLVRLDGEPISPVKKVVKHLDPITRKRKAEKRKENLAVKKAAMEDKEKTLKYSTYIPDL